MLKFGSSEHHAVKKCRITNKNIDRTLKRHIKLVNANGYTLLLFQWKIVARVPPVFYLQNFNKY
jgi:hypothetical protein